MTATFDLDGGRVRVIGPTGDVTWQGLVDSRLALDVLELVPGQLAAVRLAIWHRYRKVRNLVAIDTHGEIVWRADYPPSIPGGADSFRWMEWSGSPPQFVVNTFSCYELTLAPLTGEVLDMVFTK